MAEQATKLLGRGRFSEVKPTSDNSAAVKTIFIDEQRYPHSWLAEVEALKRLANSEYIVHVLEVDDSHKHGLDPYVCIKMPLLPLTLDSVMFGAAKAKWPPNSGWRNAIPQERVRSIVLGLATGLNAVHSAGIVHRDIRPENILFASLDSEPVLADFGISYVPGIAKNDEEPGAHAGTNEYCPPEVLLATNPYSEKTDIWGLGCVWSKLAGKNCKGPFEPYINELALLAKQKELLGANSSKRLFSQTIYGCKENAISAGLDVRFDNDLIMMLLRIDPETRPAANMIMQMLQDSSI